MLYLKPWILIDAIVERIPNQKIVTLKNITSSDFFIRGHFPHRSIYPGMLLVEGVKQSTELLIQVDNDEGMASISHLSARFIRPVLPGDTIIYTVERIADKQETLSFHAIGQRNKEVMIRMDITLATLTNAADPLANEER